mmetsp:Transcript_75580/g.216412  ORF Transcript_75580/g.216412 Transcript_75580/m.216412 type:complete len:224 (-) Transcript_75580:29-700(-)
MQRVAVVRARGHRRRRPRPLHVRGVQGVAAIGPVRRRRQRLGGEELVARHQGVYDAVRPHPAFRVPPELRGSRAVDVRRRKGQVPRPVRADGGVVGPRGRPVHLRHLGLPHVLPRHRLRVVHDRMREARLRPSDVLGHQATVDVLVVLHGARRAIRGPQRRQRQAFSSLRELHALVDEIWAPSCRFCSVLRGNCNPPRQTCARDVLWWSVASRLTAQINHRRD